MAAHRLPEPDRPWVMRTYAGHSDARRSNELYRRNLAKGQTGLSIAFDLPTQTGYDPDHVLARGEVGKVGVSIVNKGDMHTLLDGIPLDEMNTSMTINATAAWLLGLYVTVAEENGVERTALRGTIQNDIIKEYLSRGTYAFPPGPSMRLIADTVAFSVNEIPSWNPTNICSYHLQEAGATPVQEIAYALSTGVAVLDEVQARGQVAPEDFPKVFGRISFFVNAGVRFVEEHAKLRAMSELWEGIGKERYGVTDPRFLRMRYGVQVNSLGLTEAQPENNVQRIVLEALAVTLGRNARARAIQLPAWNEALGLPRPWDQQWSLRIQQVLAFETDLLEYPDVFEGSKVMDGLVAELLDGAREEMKLVADQGGAVEAVPYMKARLVESHRERVARIERSEMTVVGQNRFTETEDSPLTAGADGGILTPDPEVERERVEALESWRDERDEAAVEGALADLAEAAADEAANVMPATIAAAKAGASTGEWAQTLRDVFGDYRAPTGVSGRAAAGNGDMLAATRARVDALSEGLGHRLRILVGKPGLDGHSNGAEQIAVRARDVGMEVIYQGIRLTPEQIVASAIQEDVDVVGLSILSGSHRELVPETVRLLSDQGADVPVVVGGIIPAVDAEYLREAGVAGVYTPKDFDLSRIMGEIVDLVAERNGVSAPAPSPA
jgi:ethylmalonyl-CoA mutase